MTDALIDPMLAWLKELESRYNPEEWAGEDDANMLLGARVRNVLPQLIGVVEAAITATANDGLGTSSPYFDWPNDEPLRGALTALAEAVEKERG